MIQRRPILILAATAVLAVLALSAARGGDAPKVVTGFVADVLCSETFVSGIDPDKTFAETTAAVPGAGLVGWALDYKLDRSRKDVTVTLAGFGRSHAVYRGELGCALDHGRGMADVAAPSVSDAAQALLPEIAGPSVVAPQNPGLAAALDRAFAEPAHPPFKRTRAIVVVKDGRVVAERYAEGLGIDTPLLGFSVTKSVIATLAGIMVREGKLAPDQPAPVAAWKSPDDPRHAITVDQLLRHTAGLALGSSLQASLGAAFEPVNRMKFLETDMAAFAEAAELETAPGSAWNYHDGNYLILSRLIENAVGGRPADFLRFAQAELFGPLGMRHVTVQFDGAGTPEGSGEMLASARDWARLGLLYLNDGVAGDKRILPAGWANYAASPTPDAFVGYGAGFWINRGDSRGAHYRIEHGWPRDAFFAKGSIGQYVIVIPSERLVIVRFGRTVNWPLDADGVSDLVRDVVAATHDKAELAAGN
ncbi:serine hydrolase [Bradyrhizobium sp. NP1]|uniref:serine hydrolase domain-containing protein n=1 Tax=Bradyrhizobium sp. NP1 TaxID=3049772 RepID=UPI0025A57755|nr:serine hydrolase [Bradyrhizobium sp. NP1]WJR78265.1 serine hydrolase [Bradyrhizobium sp. NP1]